MQRIYIKDTVSKVGETVLIKGWVNIRRDHGKLIFLDIRDRTGLVQVVINPKISEEAHKNASEVRNEYVVEIEGKINPRSEKQINPNLETGKIELEATALRILSVAKAMPFEVNEDTKKVNEEVRLKYRYLDLRSERMAKNLRLRDKAAQLVREYLHKNDFIEVETPLLTKTSPEGARDYLVPSRLHPGTFYALPQAPQQYKQLLMISGIERYFQLAHALRDEDLRGDRQPQHTQIDLEMSFVKERDVLDLVEGMMIYVAESCGKKVWKKPFPVFTHEEAVKQFGGDKFDLRSENKDPDVMAFAWVVDFPLFEKDDDGKLTFAHNPFSAPKEEHVEKLLNGQDLESLRAQQYDLVCNGYELASGGVRISDPKVQRKVFEIMGLTPEQAEERFGHLVNAYEYGAPPHAGMAPGFDRLIMLLANEENIREVTAFPYNSSGQTAVMDAPSSATEKQLKELHIIVDLPNKKDK